MKSPDDPEALMARLRREHVDAFMSGDVGAFAATAAELQRQLDGVRDFNRGLERMLATLRDMEAEQ